MLAPSKMGTTRISEKKGKSLLLPKDATNFSMRFAFVGRRLHMLCTKTMRWRSIASTSPILRRLAWHANINVDVIFDVLAMNLHRIVSVQSIWYAGNHWKRFVQKIFLSLQSAVIPAVGRCFPFCYFFYLFQPHLLPSRRCSFRRRRLSMSTYQIHCGQSSSGFEGSKWP
jgi:hypothetical protein